MMPITMPHDLILGTAGHIDHGKTSLVKALTGTDCDRLPEEKARGITIDIGFAHLTLGDYRLGIVDVPGHERFIKNMLAGATGIDLALLIVAADDSVMPQTREHLEILRLLGVKQGVIALTKADLVDEMTLQVSESEVGELVRGTFLEAAPIITTSTVTGQGLDALRAALLEACQRVGNPDSTRTWFRLPIDRAFVVQGHGTVVTGSVLSGSCRVDDEFEWHKGDGTKQIVRIRGLNNHDQSVDMVHRGQRAAINLAGIPHEEVRRGQELATPGYLTPSKVLTVQLHAIGDAKRSIKHRLPMRLHVATAEVMATVSLLDCDVIAPGESGFAQLFLDEPVTTVWGQPFVLRDSSAEHTLGGGQILQPVATKIRRRHLEQLVQVEQLASENLLDRATAAAWFAGYAGFQPYDLVRDVGVDPGNIDSIVAQLLTTKSVVDLQLSPTRKLLLHADRVRELEDRLLKTLVALHEANPLMTNHDRGKTLATLEYVGDEALLQAITDRLIREKKLVGDARRIASADFKPKLSANQRKLKDRIVEEHRLAGFQPPEPGSFAHHAAGNATALGDIFEVAIAEGLLVRITGDIYLHATSEEQLRLTITERLRDGAGLTVSEIRELLGTTRKFAVPICEYLDRIGLTRRDGDRRVLR